MFAALFLLLSFSLVAAQSPAPDAADPDIELRIGNGDLLKVHVYGIPELSRQVRVGENGAVSLPLVGSFPVAGLSAKEAEAELRRRLVDGGFVRDPFVSILLEEYTTQGISVLGEVNKPGIYALHGRQRLYNVISAAGGLTEKAGRTATVTRRATQERMTVAISAEPSEMPGHNVDILPGDTVIVAKAGIVYVVGDVGRPGGFLMENHTSISVLQALAMAEGAMPTASLNRARLIRRSDHGPVEIEIPLKRILEAKSPDLPLESDDILFVPGSATRTVAVKGLEAIIRVATGVAIYPRR